MFKEVTEKWGTVDVLVSAGSLGQAGMGPTTLGVRSHVGWFSGLLLV